MNGLLHFLGKLVQGFRGQRKCFILARCELLFPLSRSGLMRLNILRFVNSNMSIFALGIPLYLSQEFEMIHQDLLRLHFSFLSAI